MSEAENEAEHLLSASEVADRLGVTQRHVSRLVNTDKIPIVGRFGVQQQLVFREEDVDKYVAQKEHHHG